MLIGGAFTHTAFAQIRHEVFLPNTDHELHVYRIFGDIPGKTVMIIGGIQGDEPGSYLTADLYADINLKKGNLIVVPRANFYSILLNRREGLTGDMNRKFDTEEKRKNNFEEEVVTVLKHLIAESDCLLNLHEGSGYYNPVWVSAIENPKRYGQSIIFDAKTYKVPGENRTIHLGDIARKVVDKVNPQIDNKRHRFRVSDHDTLSSKSIHKEQRKSATYYALTTAHIPAFGVETSKSIKSLKTKIRLHKLVINTMMEEFGIVLDPPGFIVSPPKLDYLLVTINNGHP
ncbi:MAG: succinylglutamate desuccinylase/aspartoacylase family protein, partial [Desulfobulbaceae bacterium]|nr:succinylglutamate desuccinylase/aspartoacylase family protein [Desulfobulbaceae bacterium]